MVLVERSYSVAVVQAAVDFESGFVGDWNWAEQEFHSACQLSESPAPPARTTKLREDPCYMLSDFALCPYAVATDR